jgi:Protein of unknown function (DUF4242)
MLDETRENSKGESVMPTYVIEREIPGAGQLSPAELKAISKQSLGIVNELGRGIKWLHTYVAADKMYCIYESPNAELIYEHARCMGIPATVVAEVRTIIDPRTVGD